MLFRINKTRTRYKLRDSKVSAAFHVHNYTITGGFSSSNRIAFAIKGYSIPMRRTKRYGLLFIVRRRDVEV